MVSSHLFIHITYTCIFRLSLFSTLYILYSLHGSQCTLYSVIGNKWCDDDVILLGWSQLKSSLKAEGEKWELRTENGKCWCEINADSAVVFGNIYSIVIVIFIALYFYITILNSVKVNTLHLMANIPLHSKCHIL